MGSFDIGADRLAQALDEDPQVPDDHPTAAVAAVFRRGDQGTEALFIQRASADGDPWSGHMAFPGGRTDPGDIDARYTAERETLEEVGLDLSGCRRLGAFAPVLPGMRSLTVFPLAYWLDGERPRLRANYEVADTVWVPLAVLADTDRYIDYDYPAARNVLRRTTWPGIQLDKPPQVIWGLTLRMLADLFARLGIGFIELATLPGTDP